MSTPETPPVPAPTLRVRLACWFVIYSAAMPALFLYHHFTDRFVAPLEFRRLLVGFILSLPFIPLGLGSAYGFPVESLFKHFTSIRPNTVEFWTIFITWPLAYVTYAVHLQLTWRATSRRTFLLLMLSLVLLSSAGLVGCSKEVDTIHPLQSGFFPSHPAYPIAWQVNR